MNRNPQIKQLEATRFKPVGDRQLGKIIGTRYPVEIQQVLEQLGNHQQFIREAVEDKLREEGKLPPNDAA
jgi:hypothetical protein